MLIARRLNLNILRDHPERQLAKSGHSAPNPCLREDEVIAILQKQSPCVKDLIPESALPNRLGNLIESLGFVWDERDQANWQF
jgi:hypothetical protein